MGGHQTPVLSVCCRDNQDVVNAVQKLKQFRVPQFMIDKMKTFMKSVQGELEPVQVASHVCMSMFG